jgi:hypothetical protein
MESQTLLHYILKIGVLGQIVAHVYTIKLKVRGFPHMHFFIFVVEKELFM